MKKKNPSRPVFPALHGMSIREQGGVYQVFSGRYGRNSTPVYTARRLDDAVAYRDKMLSFTARTSSPTSHATKKTAPSSKAVAFFRKWAGYAVAHGESKARAKTRGAQELARAEAEAEARGWKVEWEHDPEEWQGESERPFEVLTAVLRDADGNVMASLGGIGMSGKSSDDRAYGRVVEAELALEAL
jgi:hypothetical protein